MESILSCVEATLRRHPAPALSLSELLRLVVADGPDRSLDALRLRALLESSPDRFRVLDPWSGPWRFLRRRRRERRAPAGASDAWVVLVTDPGGQDLAGSRPARVLRESLRWMARGLDGRSLQDVGRLFRMVREEEGVRPSLRRKAA